MHVLHTAYCIHMDSAYMCHVLHSVCVCVRMEHTCAIHVLYAARSVRMHGAGVCIVHGCVHMVQSIYHMDYNMSALESAGHPRDQLVPLPHILVEQAEPDEAPLTQSNTT